MVKIKETKNNLNALLFQIISQGLHEISNYKIRLEKCYT